MLAETYRKMVNEESGEPNEDLGEPDGPDYPGRWAGDVLHELIDDHHSRLVPAHSGEVKAHLDAIVARTGKPLDYRTAISHVMDKFVDGNATWQKAAAGTAGAADASLAQRWRGPDFSRGNGEDLYMNHLLKNTLASIRQGPRGWR